MAGMSQRELEMRLEALPQGNLEQMAAARHISRGEWADYLNPREALISAILSRLWDDEEVAKAAQELAEVPASLSGSFLATNPAPPGYCHNCEYLLDKCVCEPRVAPLMP